MASLTTSLGIGLSGLQVAQESMAVIGHNIANVNTPGYSQQSAVISTNPAQEFGNLMFGTGANVNSVQALRNQFLNLQVTQSICGQSGAETRSNGLQAISSAFTDDGTTGLNTQIQNFFASIQTLSANPTDASLRQNVVGMAQTMITEFQSTSSTLTTEVSSLDQQVGSIVPQVNTLTSQIAALNTQISQQIDPSTDNDAIDQRQQLTDQLGKLVGIQVSTDSHNEYQITLDSGAATLVGGQTAYQMQAAPVPANGNLLGISVVSGGTSTDVTDKITGGTLGGTLDLRDTILPGYQTQLNQIAGSLVGQVNHANMQGGTLADAANGPSALGPALFTSNGIDPATGYAVLVGGKPDYSQIIDNLQVNASVVADPNLIAASAAPPNGAAGDNTNALAMAKLQTTGAVDTTGSGAFSTGPYSTVVSGLINAVGTQAQEYNTTATNQENLSTALQTQKTSVSGVDLDQSAAQLLSFQQGYQAAAQFISTIGQLTTQLMTAMSSAAG